MRFLGIICLLLLAFLLYARASGRPSPPDGFESRIMEVDDLDNIEDLEMLILRKSFSDFSRRIPLFWNLMSISVLHVSGHQKPIIGLLLGGECCARFSEFFSGRFPGKYE